MLKYLNRMPVVEEKVFGGNLVIFEQPLNLW